MISITGERTTWPTSDCGDRRQQEALHERALFNDYERKADARNYLICYQVFDGEAKH